MTHTFAFLHLCSRNFPCAPKPAHPPSWGLQALSTLHLCAPPGPPAAQPWAAHGHQHLPLSSQEHLSMEAESRQARQCRAQKGSFSRTSMKSPKKGSPFPSCSACSEKPSLRLGDCSCCRNPHGDFLEGAEALGCPRSCALRQQVPGLALGRERSLAVPRHVWLWRNNAQEQHGSADP